MRTLRLARVRLLRTALLCVLTLLGTNAFGRPAKSSAILWQPATLVSGSPVLFEISAPTGTTAIAASWLNHEIIFSHGSGKLWYALAGVSLETAPGSYTLVVSETVAGGKKIQIPRKIKIGRAVYPSVKVKVAKQFTEPSAEQLSAIAADKEIKQKTFAAVTPERQWNGAFLAPATAGISDVFGTARVFNGEVQSRHQGLDFAVPAGTPIHAVNSGTVILARPLFFEGNCIVLDHGQGLLSLYLHLSEFRVKEGDKVAPGQLLGLSGGTGRASGPHLHLAVRWQGVYLNPAMLLKIKPPVE